jgi:phosphotransferase system enzyme I (PtsI)
MIRLIGTPAAPGLARGPVFRLANVEHGARGVGSPNTEREAIGAAIAFAQKELSILCERTSDQQAAGILAFQLALLEDDEITQPTHKRIDAGEPADPGGLGGK